MKKHVWSLYSCMGIRYAKLFEAAKSMFKSWDSRAVWTWLLLEKAYWALICMHDVTLESVAAVTDHFADAIVRENVACVYMTLWRRNDFRKFGADAILFWEIKCKKSQGARFLKIDLAQLSSQKRFDFRNSKTYPSTTFLGTSYSQIVVAVFQKESFCTPTLFLL